MRSKAGVPGYNAVHMRLVRSRGAAKNYSCVDCGNQAHSWSYDGADPDELHRGRQAYSTKPEHYAPRCRSCHVIYDDVGKSAKRGQAHVQAKLTDESVGWLRRSELTYVEMAAALGVSRQAVQQAATGVSWRHVEVKPTPARGRGRKRRSQ